MIKLNRKRYFILSYSVILIFILMIVYKILLISYVPSESMNPTIESRAILLSWKNAYKTNSPLRGDIIVFKYPLNNSIYYIKRIIGLPGELIEIRDGQIFINNNKSPLNEEYLICDWNKDNDGFTFLVPHDSYFVLGDNRNNSIDARYWKQMSYDLELANSESEAEKYSYVSCDDIAGKLILEIYPKIKRF